MTVGSYLSDVQFCVLEAGDLTTQLLYAHVHLRHSLNMVCCGLGNDLDQAPELLDVSSAVSSAVSAIAAHGDLLDSIVEEQIDVFDRTWQSYIRYLDLREYNALVERMPYHNRFGYADSLHSDPTVREAMLRVPATRFREAFKDVYTYLRVLAAERADAAQ